MTLFFYLIFCQLFRYSIKFIIYIHYSYDSVLFAFTNRFAFEVGFTTIKTEMYVKVLLLVLVAQIDREH